MGRLAPCPAKWANCRGENVKGPEPGRRTNAGGGAVVGVAMSALQWSQNSRSTDFAPQRGHLTVMRGSRLKWVQKALSISPFHNSEALACPQFADLNFGADSCKGHEVRGVGPHAGCSPPTSPNIRIEPGASLPCGLGFLR